MRKDINVTNLGYDEWKTMRSTYLGTSEWSKVVGASKYGSPLSVYDEKMNGAEDIDNNIMKFGRLMEPVVSSLFEEKTGLLTSDDPYIRFHTNYPYLATNLDRVTNVPGHGPAVVEIKTTCQSAYEIWPVSGTDIDGNECRLPKEYMIQIQGQMFIMGYTKAYTSVFYTPNYSNDFKLIVQEHEYDPELTYQVVKELNRFWNKHILKKIPPDPESKLDIKIAYPQHEEGTAMDASNDIIESLAMLKSTKEHIKELKAHKEELETQVKLYMGTNERLTNGDKILATWKNGKSRKTFNKKKFELEHNRLYSSYVEVGDGFRRLSVK